MKEDDFEPPWPEIDTRRRLRLDFGLRRLVESIDREIAAGRLDPSKPLNLRLVNEEGSDVDWEEELKDL